MHTERLGADSFNFVLIAKLPKNKKSLVCSIPFLQLSILKYGITTSGIKKTRVRLPFNKRFGAINFKSKKKSHTNHLDTDCIVQT